MASKSVDILISADNQASEKFEQVDKSMRSTSKAFKESGGQAKASTELIGTLANVSAGASTELGGMASELATVTERMTAFSDVADQGGAGALAFQAGLAGAVGLLSFKFGKAMGDAIFQTKEFAEALDDARLKASDLEDQLARIRGDRYAETLKDIRAIADEEERRARANDALAILQDNQNTKQREIAERKRQIRDSERIFEKSPGLGGIGINYTGVFGDGGVADSLRQQNEEAEEFLRQSREYQQELNKIIAGEALVTAEKQEQTRLAEFNLELLKREVAKNNRDAEQEEQRKIRLAERFLAEKERAQKEIERIQKDKEAAENAATPAVNARGGRLLTTAPSEGYPAKTAKNTEKTNELLGLIKKTFEDWLKEQEQKDKDAKTLVVELVD